MGPGGLRMPCLGFRGRAVLPGSGPTWRSRWEWPDWSPEAGLRQRLSCESTQGQFHPPGAWLALLRQEWGRRASQWLAAMFIG